MKKERAMVPDTTSPAERTLVWPGSTVEHREPMEIPAGVTVSIGGMLVDCVENDFDGCWHRGRGRVCILFNSPLCSDFHCIPKFRTDGKSIVFLPAAKQRKEPRTKKNQPRCKK